MAYRIQFRRDTAANWLSNNPILLSGEFGFEFDTGNAKIGDGQTVWAALSYFGGTGPTGYGVASGGSTGQFLVKSSGEDYDTSWTSSIISAVPPGSSGATGTTGEMALDSNWLYVCVGTDTWKRTELTGW